MPAAAPAQDSPTPGAETAPQAQMPPAQTLPAQVPASPAPPVQPAPQPVQVAAPAMPPAAPVPPVPVAPSVQSQPQPMQAAAPAVPEEQKKAKRKIPNLLISVAALFVVFLLGRFVIGPAMSGTFSGGGSTATNPPPTLAPTQPADSAQGSSTNPEYTALFNGTRIVHLPLMFGMDTMCFAFLDEDGSIYCLDYGYKDDVILTMLETDYFNVAGFTQEEIDSITQEVEAEIDRFSAQASGRFSYEYNQDIDRLVLRYEFTELDQPGNYGFLYELGVTTLNEPISMLSTEQSLQQAGYIKR